VELIPFPVPPYEPFGETFSSTIPMTLTERLFSGQVLDSSTGLYYYGNGRYYDSSVGRYISPDPYLDAPFSSQRLDRYNFGFNNPLRYKRSEALPDFTFDSAKGVLVADAVSPASLSSGFSDSLTAGSMTWLRRGVAAAKLARTGVPNLLKSYYMRAGGFSVIQEGTYPSGRPMLRVYGTRLYKVKLGYESHLGAAGMEYEDLARWLEAPAVRRAWGEFTRAVGTKGFWAWTIGAAVLVNVIDYGWGSKADVGIGSTEFYAAVTVDLALAVASAGVGAVAVAFLLVALPAAAPAVVLLTFVSTQVGFSIFIAPAVREPAVRGVSRFYRELGQGQLVPEELGLGWGGGLLR
jgi:RHS repeat-associated protein